jgi:hypothetical protein
MVPAQQCATTVVTKLLQQQPLSDAKVAFAWRTAVGPAVARATAVTLRDGTLEVLASGEHWRREIAHSADMIVGRLAALLGRDVVQRLSVMAGPRPPASSRRE